jgi:hypothetical protein
MNGFFLPEEENIPDPADVSERGVFSCGYLDLLFPVP